MANLPKLLFSILGCEAVGLLGIPFTKPAIAAWYPSLTKPFFSPPNWIFGPVWTVLYFLMGISVYLIWRSNRPAIAVKTPVKFFFIQLLLNFLWSPVFFGLRSPSLGLGVIFLLWLTLLITIRKFYSLSRLSAYLLIPYLLWVTFASLLNLALLILN